MAADLLVKSQEIARNEGENEVLEDEYIRGDR
jgi:hypothetical protein